MAINWNNRFIPPSKRICILRIGRFCRGVACIYWKLALLYFIGCQHSSVIIGKADGEVMLITIIEKMFVYIRFQFAIIPRSNCLAAEFIVGQIVHPIF